MPLAGYPWSPIVITLYMHTPHYSICQHGQAAPDSPPKPLLTFTPKQLTTATKTWGTHALLA